MLKGHAGNLLNVFTPNDSERVILVTRQRYILFLAKEGGRLTVDACGNSAKLIPPFG